MEEKQVKVGINGFGRIGKLLARAAIHKKLFEVVVVNDPMLDVSKVAYLIHHDSIHGPCPIQVSIEGSTVIVGSHRITVFSEKDPNNVHWGDFGVDIVAECSGKFASTEKSRVHLSGGAGKVVLSAPAKDENTPTFVIGVNQDSYDPSMRIISNASCTTNCLAPLAKLLHERYGIVEGVMSTIHAVTATQNVVDGPGAKDMRSGRSALTNIIPATTGAALAVTRVLPQLEGHLTGIAFRVPVVNVSVLDFTVRLQNPMNSIDEFIRDIEAIDADSHHPMHGIVSCTRDEVVSSDFNGDARSCIVDAQATILLNPNFVKIVAYYDNEWAYAVRMVRISQYPCLLVLEYGDMIHLLTGGAYSPHQ